MTENAAHKRSILNNQESYKRGAPFVTSTHTGFSKDPDFASITAGVRSGMKEQLVSGLSGSARQIMLAALHQEMDRPLLVVTHNMFSAQK